MMDKTERKAIESERKAIKEIVKNVSNSIVPEQSIESLRAEKERLTTELTAVGLTMVTIQSMLFGDDCSRKADDEIIRELGMRLRDLTAERERNRWIPVGDEDMPVVNDVVHISKPVLIRHTSGHILMATYDGDKWSTFPISDYFIDPSSITHWRPIVPPTKEE